MTSQGPPRVVLFDLDGTLTDPSEDFIASLRHGLLTVGVPVPSDPVLLERLGPPLQDTWRALGLSEEQLPVATAAYRAHYEQQRSAGTTVHPGVPELLVELRSAGCRIGVATSKPRRIAEQVLNEVGLRDHFDSVAGAGMDESGAEKDQVIAQALAQHGDPAPEDVVMIGDRVFDIDGARKHGIAAIVVRWGFATPGEIETAGARKVVADVAELRQVLGLGGPSPVAKAT